MNKLLFRVTILLISLALGLMLTISVLGASTLKTLSTNFTLVNLGSEPAEVTIDYYLENGTLWNGSSYTTANVPADGGQVIIRQYFDTLDEGRGSVVASAGQKLGAVAQILARGQTPTSGAYSGWQEGYSKVYVPLVFKNLGTASGTSNTQIMIQNTATCGGCSVTVNINFIAAGGSPATFTKNNVVIQPGATFYYDIEGETNLNNGWYGSAEVDAGSGKVAVVVNLFLGDNGLQTYNGFPQETIGTGWAIPLFTSRCCGQNLNTPVAVQNLSGAIIPIDGVTLDCTGAAGKADFTKKNTSSIPNKGSYFFNPVTDGTIPNDWYGSCTIDSGSSNVAVFVQMRKPGFSDETGAFEAFRTNITDNMVFVPLAAKQLPTASTAITLQNLGSVDAKVKLTYKRSPECLVGNATYTYIDTIPANGGQLIQNLRQGSTRPEIPAGWYGTLKVEDDPGEPTAAQPIVGFVQITDITGSLGDTLLVHNGFGPP